MRQKCHTLTYSLTKLETDHSKLSQEVRAMKEKEQSLRIDEVSLVNTVSQRQTDRQTQRDRQTDSRHRQTDRETDRQTDRKVNSMWQ